jgi:hypothetical protein
MTPELHCTDQLTPWRAVLEKQIVVHLKLLKKCTAFYGTDKFINVTTVLWVSRHADITQNIVFLVLTVVRTWYVLFSNVLTGTHH